MDVDGIEHFILEGGKDVLKNVKSVSIEINDDFKNQALGSEKLLKDAGLSFKQKKHSSMFDNSKYKSIYNQLWVRDKFSI